MTNQFFYKRKEVQAPKPGEEGPQFKVYSDSFNIEKVIRTVELEDGRMSIALDDMHERIQHNVPIQNKTGKITGYKNEKYVHQSIINLEVEDAIRFKVLTEIYVPKIESSEQE